MAFFPPDPEIPDPDHDENEYVQPPWVAAPEDELPALHPAAAILARTEYTAIALIGIAVYREGVEFQISRRLRRNGLPSDAWHDMTAAFMGQHHPWGRAADTAEHLRFGVLLGDGQQLVADGFPFERPGEEPPRGHRLSRSSGGSGGGGRSFSGTDRLWLWPAPPPGPLELVMQWPALGIEESRTTLDTDEMIALASRAHPFWSEENEET